MAYADAIHTISLTVSVVYKQIHIDIHIDIDILSLTHTHVIDQGNVHRIFTVITRVIWLLAALLVRYRERTLLIANAVPERSVTIRELANQSVSHT